MKKYYLFLIVIFNFNFVDAQIFCGTPSEKTDPLSELTKQQLSFPSNSYQVRIFVHIIRNSSGMGGITQLELETALNTLSSDFNPFNICFILVGQDYIDNNVYFNWNDVSAFPSFPNSIFNVNATENAIDIYFLPNGMRPAGGLAAGIGAKSLLVGGTWTSNSFGNVIVNTSHIISHEMGHCLGLFHTHNGWLWGQPIGVETELVNGSNGTTTGDYVQDTPADKGIEFNVNLSCEWLGSGVDANNEPYNPDEKNIMSYTMPSCMEYLSTGQLNRMLLALSSNTVLEQVTIENGICCASFLNLNSPIINSQDFRVSESIRASCEIQSDINVNFKAKRIQLRPGFSVSALQTGSFSATVNPCSDSNEFSKQASSIEGFNNKNPTVKNKTVNSFNINLYPNPVVDGVLYVDTQTNAEKNILVFDLLGKQVINVTITSNKLNVATLKEGVYIVKIIENENIATRRLVVNK